MVGVNDLGVAPHCSVREVSRDESFDCARERSSFGSAIEDERRARNDGDGGDDVVSSRLHFSEQYNNELLGVVICF